MLSFSGCSFGWFTDPENITDCQWRRLSDLREEFGAAAVDDYLKVRTQFVLIILNY